MERMRSVLVIARNFPPDGGPGVQRIAKWAKYLPGQGWQPIVITGRRRPDIFPQDEALLADVASSEIEVIRCEPLRSRLNGRVGAVLGRAYELVTRRDRPWSWKRAAFLGGFEAARKYGCQAIVSSSYPVVAHDVGRQLARRLGLPWIADVRDPLVGGRDWFFLTKREKRRRRCNEKRMVTYADAIINVHEMISDDLANRYRRVPRSKFLTILNGYDLADVVHSDSRNPEASKFTLSFIGTLHEEMNLRPFCVAVERLCGEDYGPGNALRVRFYGRLNQELKNQLAAHRCAAISSQGYISHGDVARAIADSDVLLLPVSPLPYGQFTCTGKIFEYIGAKKPILMMGPRSSPAAKIVQESSAGLVVDEADPAGISQAIQELFELRGFFDERFYSKPTVLEKYRRDVQASQLAHVLNAAVEKNNNSKRRAP